ncbi:hypothetical protein NIES2104_25220 [Leptolyngbya sp. NIES-2104]|nr:hypothetical protein NIES2104_25220 [Leptolyngbya sp. NIES-2104]
MTFDTNLIQFGVSNPFYNTMSRPVYFTRQPTSLLIDFFGNRYTSLPVFRGAAPRDTPIFVFNRTGTGGYQLSYFDFGTGNESTLIAISGLSGANQGQFSYFGGSGIADARVTFTNSSEVIPEPTTIAGVPTAIALSWAFHRRLKRRSKPR